METWQPIETAPKEKDLLLLYLEREGVRAGYWEPGAGWYVVETQTLTSGVMEPTHWMPLADPPADGREETGA